MLGGRMTVCAAHDVRDEGGTDGALPPPRQDDEHDLEAAGPPCGWASPPPRGQAAGHSEE